MRVLVVEDDAGLRGLWTELFTEAGHDVTGAESAGEARTRLLARRYDVAVLDLHLGSESGLSVAMFAAYANPDCKVIMTTGSSLFAKGELFDIAPSVTTELRKPVRIDAPLRVGASRADRLIGCLGDKKSGDAREEEGATAKCREPREEEGISGLEASDPLRTVSRY